jgi:hypothetical protein
MGSTVGPMVLQLTDKKPKKDKTTYSDWHKDADLLEKLKDLVEKVGFPLYVLELFKFKDKRLFSVG